ncbi:MAG: glycosyltransferase family 4 protein [Thermoflavifilum sp.]|nr:glycosyltransferase family 4 protein [Thermoflavifilum sp.]
MKLHIAQVAPLYESVPPKLYGGTERVVAYLTEALIDKGHEVTLFASGDSHTRAELVSHLNEAIRLNSRVQDPMAHHVIQMADVAARAHEFDILHFHTDYLHFPLSDLLHRPHVTTLHGRLDLPDLPFVYRRFSHQPVISISFAQRQPLPFARWVGNVYHGLPRHLYHLGKGDGGYVAFIGRISPEKRADLAIEIAQKAGYPIYIAAKVDKADEAYFAAHIRHLFDLPHVHYIGEIGDREKDDFLGKAKALLFPIDWPEPFGMVMIEAMACGTPVIAFNRGSVPEVIDHGVTGFIVNHVQEAVGALKKIDDLDRKRIRQVFETRFTAEVMADNYLHIYHQLCGHKVAHQVFFPEVFVQPNTLSVSSSMQVEKSA